MGRNQGVDAAPAITAGPENALRACNSRLCLKPRQHWRDGQTGEGGGAGFWICWWWWVDLNHRPTDYEAKPSAASLYKSMPCLTRNIDTKSREAL